MSSLAQKLKHSMFGGIFGHGQPATTTSSAPIRNSRGEKYSSTAPDSWSEQDKYAFGTLRYPDELGTAEYGHYLMFHIWQVEQSVYAGPQTERNLIGRATGHIPQKEHDLFSPKIAYSQDKEELTNVQRNIDPESEHWGNVSSSLRLSKRLTRTSDTIALYMPPNLKTSYGANYKSSETGIAGVVGPDVLGAGTTWTDMFRGLIGSSSTTAMRDQIIDLLAVRGITKVSDFVSGGDMTGVVRKAAQKALNPALEAIFQSVDLRKFEFSFRFTPRSEKELKQVHAIIKLFKFHMLPERVSGQNVGRHLIFPSEFDIQYMYQTVENQWYPFVTGCVLQSMDVAYGPGGETQHFRPLTPHGGQEAPAPTEINMTLGFMETEIMTKEKIVEGH